jgi:hypothetical protein
MGPTTWTGSAGSSHLRAFVAVAPVAGFGCLLLVLGLVQTDPRETRLRALYVAVYVLVLLYAEAPWASP